MKEPWEILPVLFSGYGRSPRKTYWYCVLAHIAIFFALGALSSHLGNMFGLMWVMYILFGWILFIGVRIRRLHDVNMRGWWLLLEFIPVFGALVVVVICGFIKGTDGPNRFGPNP